MGFGPFIFEHHDTKEIGRAANLFHLERALKSMSDHVFYDHWVNNDFSRWLFTRAETLLATELRAVTKDHFDDDLTRMRTYLSQRIHDWRMERQKGVMVDFDEEDFEQETELSKLETVLWVERLAD